MKLYLSLLIIVAFKTVFATDTLIYVPLGKTHIDIEVPVKALKSISTGAFHSYGIDENNKIITFKDNSAPVISPPELKISLKALKTGNVHSIGLLPNKEIIQFFATPYLDMYYPSRIKNVREIGAGPNMSYALNEKNMMYVWGAGSVVNKNNIFPITYGVSTGSIGENHTAFINVKNRVFIWGDHSKGQNDIPNFKGTPVKIVSGDNHILVLDINGEAYAWGDTSRGQCHLPSGLGKIVNIYAKNNLSAIQSESGFLHVFGNDVNEIIDLSIFNKVHKIEIGNDYIMLSVDYEPSKGKNGTKSFTQYYAQKLKSSYKYNSKKESSELLETIAKSNFNRNSFKVLESNTKVKNNSNSTQQVVFEGKGNSVKIMSDGITYDVKNNHQRVIFKGNNNNVVIKQKNMTVKGSNDTSVIIIDLDQYAQENGDELDTYMDMSKREYQKALFEEKKANVEQEELGKYGDVLQYLDSSFFASGWEDTVLSEGKDIEGDWISDWEEESGVEYVYNPEQAMGESNIHDFTYGGKYTYTYNLRPTGSSQNITTSNIEVIIRNIDNQRPTYYKARAYLFIGNQNKMVETLIECANVDDKSKINKYVIIELYHIYKDGTYGVNISDSKAKYYLNLFCEYNECEVYMEE